MSDIVVVLEYIVVEFLIRLIVAVISPSNPDKSVSEYMTPPTGFVTLLTESPYVSEYVTVIRTESSIVGILPSSISLLSTTERLKLDKL